MKNLNLATVIVLAIVILLSFSSSVIADAILYGSDSDTQNLYAIDTTTTQTTLVGSFGVAGYMAGLAYDSDKDIMYGTTTGTNNLYSIDYKTGDTTLIGSLGVGLIHGLAYDNSSNTLFGAFGNVPTGGLYRIDVNTGNTDLIGSIGVSINWGEHVHGMAIHPQTKELYGVMGGPSQSSGLVIIDKNTGEGTLLHEYSMPNLSGLAFLDDETVYASDNWSGNLYKLNITDGSTQLIGNTGLGNLLGLTVVPEPCSLLLLGLGAIALRKRKA